MCGRYSQRLTWSELAQLYDILDLGPIPNDLAWFNIAPTQTVAIIRLNERGERQLVGVRWGLIPSWAKDASIAAKMINARAETVSEKPAFRAAMRARRCLVPADGFYEWQKLKSGGKQPYHLTLEDGRPFVFAGLWERWVNPSHGVVVESCTIITTEANDFVRPIHGRMPVILEPEFHERWLDTEHTALEETHAVLRAMPSESMRASSVSRRINRVDNDDVECLMPPDPTLLP